MMEENTPLTDYAELKQLVYRKRVHTFFGRYQFNLAACLVTALILIAVLGEAGAPLVHLAYWYLGLFLIGLGLIAYERAFNQCAPKDPQLPLWLYGRIACGVVLNLLFGLFPFIFHSYFSLYQEAVMLIIASAIVTIAAMSYSTMPLYYILISCVTLLPLTIFLLIYEPMVDRLLLAMLFAWQILVLFRGWKVSQIALHEIFLRERLKTEIGAHNVTKQQFRETSKRDALTQLYNRSQMLERMETFIENALLNETKFAVFIININQFRVLNQTLGSKMGDKILKITAKRLLGSAQAPENVGRIGNDEFLLLFTDVSGESDTDTIAASLFAQLSEPIRLSPEQEESITSAIGIAIFPQHATSRAELLSAAEKAVSQAKKMGSNSHAYSMHSYSLG